MPNRIRTIYQSEFLYVGPTPSTGQQFSQFAAESLFSGANLVTGFYRIQSCNYGPTITRVPVNQFGELAAIDRPIIQAPTVDLSFSYLLANFWNERILGFNTDGTQVALSGIMAKQQDDKNYWLRVVPVGQDAVGNLSNDVNTYWLGFGNGYVTSYSSKAAVNSFPSVDVQVTAANFVVGTGISGLNPAVDPSQGTRINIYNFTLPSGQQDPGGVGLYDISVLRPGDITLDFKQRNAVDEGNLSQPTNPYTTFGGDLSLSDVAIQDYNLSFALNREAIQKLGNKFPISREITFPVDVNLTINALVGNLITGSLSDYIYNDQCYDITINVKQPVPPGTPQPVICRYAVKNARLNRQSYSSSIGSNKTVSYEFSSQIGGPSQSTLGVFMSGIS